MVELGRAVKTWVPGCDPVEGTAGGGDTAAVVVVAVALRATTLVLGTAFTGSLLLGTPVVVLCPPISVEVMVVGDPVKPDGLAEVLVTVLDEPEGREEAGVVEVVELEEVGVVEEVVVTA